MVRGVLNSNLHSAVTDESCMLYVYQRFTASSTGLTFESVEVAV